MIDGVRCCKADEHEPRMVSYSPDLQFAVMIEVVATVELSGNVEVWLAEYVAAKMMSTRVARFHIAQTYYSRL